MANGCSDCRLIECWDSAHDDCPCHCHDDEAQPPDDYPEPEEDGYSRHDYGYRD